MPESWNKGVIIRNLYTKKADVRDDFTRTKPDAGLIKQFFGKRTILKSVIKVYCTVIYLQNAWERCITFVSDKKQLYE